MMDDACRPPGSTPLWALTISILVLVAKLAKSNPLGSLKPPPTPPLPTCASDPDNLAIGCKAAAEKADRFEKPIRLNPDFGVPAQFKYMRLKVPV